MIDASVIDLCNKVLDFISTEFKEKKEDICIAGGFLRDYHFRVTPKDIDVFILNKRPGKNEYDLGWSFSIEKNIEYLGFPLQIIPSRAMSVDSLLASFDWHVCRFAFNGSIYYPYSECVLQKFDVDFFLSHQFKDHKELMLHNGNNRSLNHLFLMMSRGLYLRDKLKLPIQQSSWDFLVKKLAGRLNIDVRSY